MKRILYIGWIGFNNLGDELLWNLFKDTCGKYFTKDQIDITPSVPGIDLKKIESYDTVILGGGSLLLPGYLEILQDAIRKGKSVIIWGSGLDWIEKRNLDLLAENKLDSMEQNFKQKDIEVLDEVIEKALFVGVRGPLTKKAIEIMIGHEKAKKVEIIGDPGLLLQEPAVGIVKENLIGINWGTTFNRLYGGNEKLVEKQLVEAAKKLIQQGYKILLYTVWPTDTPYCERLYKAINDPANVVLDKKLYKEQELMKVLSKCKATINFKLHANYLSLTAKTPAIALGYRFKVFDNAALLGFQHLVISTDSTQITQEILNCIEAIEKNGTKIIREYQSTKKKYTPLLESIFTNSLLNK